MAPVSAVTVYWQKDALAWVPLKLVKEMINWVMVSLNFEPKLRPEPMQFAFGMAP